MKRPVVSFAFASTVSLLFAGCAPCEADGPSRTTLVANPVAAAKWETPSYRGKAFWPLFAKLNHTPDEPGKPKVVAGSSVGLEDLPLTREYASEVRTHNGTSGVAKYRRARGFSGGPHDAKGRRVFYFEIPESERHQGTYTLRHLFGPGYGDYLYEGDWSERRLWNPVSGCPFLIGVDESRPCFCLDGLDRGDKADFAAWRAKHPDFIGFSAMGEIDSDSANYRRAMLGEGLAKVEGAMRADFEKRFGVWKDRYDFVSFMRKCWQTEINFHFGQDMFWPLYCNNHGLAHINAKLGAKGLQNEISSSQGSPWSWSGAYTRGASRQWGIPFTWYCATFYRGFTRDAGPDAKPVTGDNMWPRNGVFTKKRPAYRGASLSLTARQKYYGWLIGAAMIQDEPWTMLSASATNGVPCPSPYAKVFNDVFVRSTKIERGAPLTPIALLTPLTETTSRGGYAAAVEDKAGNELDPFSIPAFLFTLTPVRETSAKYPMCQERRRKGDEGCLFNSPFGEIWDVLTVDSGLESGRMAETLKHYPAAFLAGTYRKGDLDVRALESYVRDGGTLFLSCDYVEEGLVSADLAGVDFVEEVERKGGGGQRNDKITCLTSGLRPSTLCLRNAYTLHAGRPRQGTRVLYQDEKGVAVAWAHDLGKGRVVTTAARRSLPDALNEPCKFGSDVFNARRLTLLDGTAELTLLRELLTTVQAETIPVKVDGDIQWGVNCVEGKREEERGKSDGWLVWLFNNKGIAKFVGEPADVDQTKTATVALSMRNVKEPAAYVFRDADTGAVLDPSAVKVGPGDARFVTVCRK